MKTLKNVILKTGIIFLSLILIIFAGCAPQIPAPDGKDEPYTYDDDFICGYFLTFRDESNPNWISPSSNDFESKDAVKVYATIHYPSPDSYKGWLYAENGLPVNTGTLHLEGDPLCENKSGAITLHDKIYYTYDLADKTVIISAVMYNAAERKTYTQVLSHSIIGGGFSQMFGREMEALVDDGNGGLKSITYNPDFSVTFERTDKLCGLEIIQFGKNDEKLASDVYTEENFNSIPYVFTADTESVEGTPAYAPLNRSVQYVIVKKTYENYLHEQYTERVLLNNDGNTQKAIVPVPKGGLVTLREIQFNFSVLDAAE